MAGRMSGAEGGWRARGTWPNSRGGGSSRKRRKDVRAPAATALMCAEHVPGAHAAFQRSSSSDAEGNPG